MPRLRRVDCSGPGIARRPRGRGFEYRDASGTLVQDPETLARIRALAIPPAWREVWICSDPLGHLQATGVDDAGRKQYLYHERWRIRREREKFDRMLDFAAHLPQLRARAAVDLAAEGLGRERVLACAVRLLDRGFFRVGGEDYAEDNGTYGLATMQKRHVTLERGNVVKFDYRAKGGQRRVQSVVDADVFAVVRELKRRRGSPKLLAYKRGRAWADLRSDDINESVKQAIGEQFSAKDFRTWNATVLAAVSLAVVGKGAHSETAHKRVISYAVKEVAHYLGNTAAVCRASYIDPRLFDRFNDGLTIGGVLDELGEDTAGRPETQGAVEVAVLALLEERLDEPAIERLAVAA